MSKERRRLVGNILIFGISGPSVLAILVLALVVKPWTGESNSFSYLLFPIFLIGACAAHAGSLVKSRARA